MPAMLSEIDPGHRPQIFIIEDDDAIARIVERTLKEFEFSVECFRDGSSVLRRLQIKRPDLCIVDLGLPDIDGIELIRKINELANCGVLILTGRGQTIDRVMGLELGADDYVVKPFEPRELVARVRSILRRRHAGDSAVHNQRRYASFSSWTLDCAANILHSPDGSEHILGTAEAIVLRAFLQRPHQILTREQLIGQRDLSPLDRSIDVRISRIRRKLEVDPQNPKIIKTVYGAGYMLMAVVTWS